MTPRILCAGVGNIFFRDDGFGVAVAHRFAQVGTPDCVRVEDYGIRAVHLAYELLAGYDALVLIDALPMAGEPPGTLAVLEPEAPWSTGRGDDVAPVMDAHIMSPQMVLTTLAHLGGSVGRVLVVGCQPATVAEGMGLSDPVAAAVDRAVEMVTRLLTELARYPKSAVGRETRTCSDV
ncbi:MAG: hydrogenase maturation protease [Actinomycetota bacterium]|nr:hydrogenase maturation protease [Actinomycetota bacterium]